MSDNTANEIKEKIKADRVALLNQYLLFSIPANLLCSLILFIGLQDAVNPTWLTVWFAVMLASFFLHGCLFSVNHFKPLTPTQLLRCLIGITILYGTLWGIAGSILMPYDNLLYQMLVIIIIAGIASGGLHTLQPSGTASVIFFTLTLIPMSIWFFFQNALTYFLLGISMLSYFCFILIVSWLASRLLKNNLKLRYENLDLVQQLTVNNATLEESELRFRTAFDYAAIGMALISLKGRWLKVNKALCQIAGYTEEELLKLDYQQMTYPEDLELDVVLLQQLLQGKIPSYQAEKRYFHKNGDLVWILLNVTLLRDTENKPLYFIAQIQNIDAQKRAEEELNYIAHHDTLTNLSNRKQLNISFEFAVAYAKRHSTHIAIMFLDLDYFKEINDNHGHEIGDLLLIEVASRLKSTLRSTDFLGRLGGDEFIIALTEITDKHQIICVAKKILANIAQAMTIKQLTIKITCSIGISLYPTDGKDLNTLIKHADEALYLVKSKGKNNFKFYTNKELLIAK